MAAGWLAKEPENRDFATGLLIFNQIPGHSGLKRIFAAKGDNDYNRGKLERELEKFAASGRTIMVAIPSRMELAPPPPDPEAPPTETIPDGSREKLDTMIQERKDLFREAAYEHDRLDVYPDQEKRHEACLAIYWRFKRINQIFRIEDHFKETGELLEEEPLMPKREAAPVDYTKMDHAELLRALANLRTRRTKAKNSANTEKEAAIQKDIDLVESLITKFEELKKQSG